VLGDPLYGPRRIPGGLPAAPRLCLHCARLALPEPMIRELSRLDDSLSAGLTNVVEGAPPDPRVPGETPGPAAAPREGRFLIMAPFPPELTRYLAALTRQPGKV
jgi:hypothetical protein